MLGFYKASRQVNFEDINKGKDINKESADNKGFSYFSVDLGFTTDMIFTEYFM